jgi:hypothetical protein
LQIDPRKEIPLAIGSPRVAGGGLTSNPARARRSPVGEGQRKGLGTTKDLFVVGEGGGAALASSSAGAGRRPPQERRSRRGCWLCRATRGSRGCGGRSWWRGCAQTAILWRGGGSSPWPAMAAMACPRGHTAAPLYRHERRDATTLRERSVAGTRLPQGVCAGLGRNARQGKGADGPVVNSGCGRRRMRELHVAAQTSRAASVRATPWEDARPRRRGWCGAGEARAGARRRVLVPNCFTVPLFDCDFLPILQ